MIRFIFRVIDRLHRELDRILSQWHAKRLVSCGPGAIIRTPRKILGGYYIHVGSKLDVFPGLRIEAFDHHLGKSFTPRITIGDRVSINYDCHIGCVNEIRIGNDVLMASRVYITDHSHGAPDYHDIDTPPSSRKVYSKGPVIIEDEVWIGEGACILPNVTIGRGSIIGANSVVTKNIPPFSIACGSPARVIKKLRQP